MQLGNIIFNQHQVLSTTSIKHVSRCFYDAVEFIWMTLIYDFPVILIQMSSWWDEANSIPSQKSWYECSPVKKQTAICIREAVHIAWSLYVNLCWSECDFAACVWTLSVCPPLSLLLQPTVTATPKATKNGKPGYDDTTLPLMEKNQGQWRSQCVRVHDNFCFDLFRGPSGWDRWANTPDSFFCLWVFSPSPVPVLTHLILAQIT